MLNIIEYGKDGYEFPALIVLGCFDAIHAGHRELLKKAKLQAKINGLDLGVMMFKEGKSGKLVYSFEERCAFLEQYNVKFVVAVDFNDEFKAIAPLDFLHELEDKINVKAYMSGKDFRFGAQAKGKSSTLKNYAEDEENGVWYMPVKDIDLNGEKISTTLIKSCLDGGNIKKANELLGGEFSVSGEVVKGEGRGTSVVGFPTVNIVYPEWKHPIKHGVYSVKCTVGENDYQGIANFGTCPTFADERVALEVYLEGYSGDLYGQILTVRFVDYIRDIEEFASAEELSGQLQNDLLTVSDELAATEEEPVTEAVAEPVTEPVEETVTEAGEDTETEAVEVESQPVEEVAEEPAEEITETVIEEPAAEEPAEETVEEPAEEVVETVVEEQPEETEEEVETVADEVVVEPEEVIEEQPEKEIAEETEPTVTEENDTETVVEEINEDIAEGITEDFDDGLDEVIEPEVEEISFEEPETEPEQPAEEVKEEPVETVDDAVEEVIEEPTEIIVEETVEAVDEEIIEEPAATEEVADEEYAVVDEVVEEAPAETVDEVAEEEPAVAEEMQYTEGEETAEVTETAETTEADETVGADETAETGDTTEADGEDTDNGEEN